MTAPVVLRPALPPDRAAIDRLLRGAGLRSEGEQLPIEAFVVAEAGSSIVGAVALEARGGAGLVRSLAVDAAWRGRGLGDRLVAHLLANAAQQDLAKLWLLTTTASAFFARWGFAKARRDEAPAAIATHPQFAAECPASATCMALALPRGDSAIDLAVHHALVRGFIDAGRVPPNRDLATRLGIAVPELERALHRLASSHSLVLHPHAPEPWLVHPFSTSPTHTWIARGNDGWWAPCLWCGLGVAAVVGGDVVVHTRLGGEADSIAIPVTDGRPRAGGPAVCAHFPAPPRTAWDNVHHFCARLLPFRNGGEVDAWCARHGLPRGEVLALDQLADLARRWYGGHARPDWRKWTVTEAAAIFRDCGLTGAFWQLETRDGAF